ncbi:hypothetical protein [Fibrella forsythiae]|uniref:Uncharacterized protein n=1 Tax=Fibrella forsythiae TaxID=2817061 RepID=A0ABS3JT55_9BACT|nr:hypothetical protein [Fibrella forsythiae]MBO0953182.1 hypothetical protein [Fibrella forsythiae]
MSPAPPCPVCQSTRLSIRRKVVPLPDPLPLDGWLAVGIPLEDILGIRCQHCQYTWSRVQPSPQSGRPKPWQAELDEAIKKEDWEEVEHLLLTHTPALGAPSDPLPATQQRVIMSTSLILVMLALAAVLGWIISVAWWA